MNWRDAAFLMAGFGLGGIFGMIVGLSLGFRIGTKRTIMLFTRYFPTLQTMDQLVKVLFSIANRLEKEGKKPDEQKPN